MLKISKAQADATLIAKGEIGCSELEDHFTLSQRTVSHPSSLLITEEFRVVILNMPG